MNSRNVLKLYRQILRTIKQIPDETDRQYMKNWARSDFKNYKNVTDDVGSMLQIFVKRIFSKWLDNHYFHFTVGH